MASSSSTSSIHKINFKYDVFLSFRGEDTRTSFVDHLYDALKRQNIEAYKDDKNLNKGKKISKELIQAIEESRFHVIVFSKNYASSSWCLDELVKIIECQKTQIGQTVYPIFYDVEPTQVRKQSGEFGKAFAKHENDEAAEKWREALVEATSFSGRDLSTTADGHEVEFIKLVVKDISSKLPVMSADGNLIGMRTRINGVVSSLNAFPDELCMIGIWGMGGGGKTTLARVVFDEISFQFEGISFVANVREVSKPDFSGLNKLQQQVLRNVSNDQGITIDNVFDGKALMKKKMPGRKVLVVLDDVDHIDQLKALAGEPNWFKPGSKIIVTTRDKQVLLAHKIVNSIHDVNLLNDEEAICLLSRCAFDTNIPIPGYEELSRQVVSYAAGLPLTITVLGSFLCGKIEDEWRSAIQRLETIPSKDTLDVLEISYIGLEDEHKEMFLDIACILKYWPKEDAIRVLESCGFYARIGLRVLEQKSLITISKDIEGDFLDMHDKIEEMGRYIVRRKLEEPNKHSRLWINEEIEDILVSDQGTNEAVRCIKLDTSYLDPKLIMKGLGNMKKLRFLEVYCVGVDCSNSNWEFDEVREYFPNALQCLVWQRYPFGSLPTSFQANNLVQLEMIYSKIEQLWEGGDRKVLNKLRFLDLSYSEILKNLDLGLAPNLEILNLQGCSDLGELRMPAECPKLRYINIDGSKLRTLELRGTPNLETLSLVKCVDLVELHIPVECLKLREIVINGSKLTTLDLRGTPNLEDLLVVHCLDLVELYIPVECLKLRCIYVNNLKLRTLDLRGTPNLETLYVEECVDLVELHIPVECLKLESININDSKLTTLELRGTRNLETLSLVKCVDLVELHIPVEALKLKSIDMNGSKLTTLDLRGTPNLETLSVIDCDDLVQLNMNPVEYLLKLRSLDIYFSKLRTLDLQRTPNLEKLHLEDCVDLVELHIHGECLKLESINIMGAKLRTFDLGWTPNLKKLSLIKCSHLVELQAHDGCLKKLDRIDLSDCLRFKSFSFRRQFESVEVGSVSKLHLIAESLDMCPLHFGNNLPKFRFECFYEEHGPSLIGNVEKLISFGLCVCTNLERFSQSICGLQSLTKLTLEGIIPEAPKDLDQLECLEELHLVSTKITHLPDSICMLKYLKHLELNPCWLLEKLPEDIGRLECLEKLILVECVFLRDIPESICKLKRLRYFHLKYCVAVEKLPEELGCLTFLEELNIEGTGITQLPQSIFLLKGLRIVAFIRLLELCGFTSEIQASEHESFCYI